MLHHKVHPLTLTAIAFLCASAYLFFADLPAYALLMSVIAYVLVLIEFKTRTSVFQFIMILVSASWLGIIMDVHLLTWPLAITALFLIGVATIMRQAWMQRFTYVHLLWVEPLLLVTAAVLLWIMVDRSEDSVLILLVPLLPYIGALVLVIGYVEDGFRIKKKLKSGYQVQVGSKAVDFELPDQQGVPVRLSAYFGLHPVLLIFVRGDWCPGCHMMLRNYEKHRQEFQGQGVHVLAIGPDSIDVNKDLVSRIGVNYKLLSDPGQKISSRYGVTYQSPLLETAVNYTEGIPLPASFLVDADGVVRYVSKPEGVGQIVAPGLIFDTLNALARPMDRV